jgi:hypothetical protein
MPPRVVRANPNALHRDLQGEGVLLQLETGEYFGLDEIGERFWTLIVEHGDLDAVQARLLEEFDVEPDVLARDLDDLVNELIEKQLVDVVAAAQSRPGS